MRVRPHRARETLTHAIMRLCTSAWPCTDTNAATAHYGGPGTELPHRRERCPDEDQDERVECGHEAGYGGTPGPADEPESGCDGPDLLPWAWNQALAKPLAGAQIYTGWMYLGNPVALADAEAMPPRGMMSLPGMPIATGFPGALPATIAVVFAIYGTALDLSELEGLLPGSVLLLDGARMYQITGKGSDAAPTERVRFTLVQH